MSTRKIVSKKTPEANEYARNSLTKILHIYTRVSTLSQQVEGTSLNTQLELGIKKAKELGFEYRHWDEGGKSSNHENVSDRPVFNSLYNAIKNDEVKHLFVFDQSRLSRNDAVASVFRHECRKKSVNIYTKDGNYSLSNPSDNLLSQVMSAVAEFDNSVRTDRSRRGKAQRASQGYWMWGGPPFGYKVENKKLVENEQESRWLKYIYEMRAKGVSVGQIKLALDANEVKPKVRSTWCVQSIRLLIRNTHAIGYYTVSIPDSDKRLEISCPRLIDDALWMKANEAIDEERTRRFRKNKAVIDSFLCRELSVCAHCGRRLVLYDTQATKNTVYYCPMKQRQWAKLGKSLYHKKRKTGCGLERSIRAISFDEAIVSAVSRAFHEPNLYLERYECSVLSGHSIVRSHVQYVALRRQLTELRAIAKSLPLMIEKAEHVEPSEARELSGWGKPAYALRLRQKDISNELEYIELVLSERDQYMAYKKWFEDSRDKLERMPKENVTWQRSLLAEVISTIEVRYNPSNRSHILKIHYKNPLMREQKVVIERVPRARGKFVSSVRSLDETT